MNSPDTEETVLASVKAAIAEGGTPHDIVDAAEGLTRLHAAALHGYVTPLAYLVECGGDVNVRINVGPNLKSGTPLHYASTDAAVNFLLSQGADRDAPGPANNTPLAAAARRARLSAVEALVEHGADINARDGLFGMSVLMWACAGLAVVDLDNPGENRYAERMDVIRYLALKGAAVNATDNDGQTALHLAAKYDPKFDDLLLRFGADANAKDDAGKLPVDWSRELEQSEAVELLAAAQRK